MTNERALVASVGALLSWLATACWQLPLPWFLPLQSQLEWAVSVQGVGIDLFGRGLWLVAGALAGMPLARFVRAPRAASLLTWVVLILFWACVTVELAAAGH